MYMVANIILAHMGTKLYFSLYSFSCIFVAPLYSQPYLYYIYIYI